MHAIRPIIQKAGRMCATLGAVRASLDADPQKRLAGEATEGKRKVIHRLRRFRRLPTTTK
jgi:hypothetical protein